MSNVAFDYNRYNSNKNNIIEFDFAAHKVVDEHKNDNPYDGNRAGMSCEVYAFCTQEEIKAMIGVYDKHINETVSAGKRKIACRNKMLFIIGINVGLRASDLRTLTWDFFFERMPDGSLKFRDGYNLRPKKTRKTGKYVKLYFNDSVKKVISWYVSMYPIENINDFMFKSRVGNDAITVNGMWRVIKDAAKEAGIERNIGTHSLRKAYGYWVWHNAQDKNKALVVLSRIFNHSSIQTTMNYIGIMNNDIEDTFNGLNLGFDMI